MTLREVAFRLERIEQMRFDCTDEYGRLCEAPRTFKAELEALRLDIERYVLKTEGRL